MCVTWVKYDMVALFYHKLEFAFQVAYMYKHQHQ